jgi:hypothetical protein
MRTRVYRRRRRAPTSAAVPAQVETPANGHLQIFEFYLFSRPLSTSKEQLGGRICANKLRGPHTVDTFGRPRALSRVCALRAGVTLRLGCGGRSHLRDLGGQWQSTALISGSVQAPQTKILQVELDYARTQQHQRSKAIDRLAEAGGGCRR